MNEIYMYVLFVVGLSIAFTAGLAVVMQERDILRLWSLFLDCTSILVVGLLAVAGAAAVGLKLAQISTIQHIDDVPLAMFALIGVRYMLLERQRIDRLKSESMQSGVQS